MPTISILLPSLHENLGRRCIRNILGASQGHDYKIVVVSPWDASVVDSRVEWVQETNPQGSVMAAQNGFTRSEGEFVVQMCEDASPLPGWLGVCLRHMQEWSPACIALHQGAMVAGLNGSNATGTHGYAGTAFGRLYANFPFMVYSEAARMGWHRADLYRAHYADVHLGMQVWESGGRVELTTLPGRQLPQPCVTWERDRMGCPEAAGKGSSRLTDWQTFRNYWDKSNLLPEHEVNIDVPFGLLPYVLSERSIVNAGSLSKLIETARVNYNNVEKQT